MIEPGQAIQFEAIPPLTNDHHAAHIRLALALGLPEADAREKRLTVVANGPSAQGIKFKGQTLAVNGAHSLFTKDNPPTFWAGVDPQEHLADLIAKPFANTTYLVGSQCHPRVFETLKHNKVRVWHISNALFPPSDVRIVPCATSVTLTSLMLMQRLGYRTIDVYGWDCCFNGEGQHHAGEGRQNASPTIDVQCGDKTFKTTHTWCAEVNDAMGLLPVMEWCGVEVNLHGDGMLAAIREFKSQTPETMAA